MVSRFEWLLILFGLGVIQIICFWGIDISVSAMLTDPRSILTNGWNIKSPVTIYHLCLYVSIFVTIVDIIIATHIVEKFTDKWKKTTETDTTQNP